MSKKDKLPEGGEQQKAAASHRARKAVRANLIAIVVCLALAVLIWICVMNTTDTDYVALKAEAGTAETCVFSAALIEVEGPVAQLKKTSEVEVSVSGLAPGVYALTEDMLKLPKDVHLAGDAHVTVTVGSANG